MVGKVGRKTPRLQLPCPAQYRGSDWGWLSWEGSFWVDSGPSCRACWDEGHGEKGVDQGHGLGLGHWRAGTISGVGSCSQDSLGIDCHGCRGRATDSLCVSVLCAGPQPVSIGAGLGWAGSWVEATPGLWGLSRPFHLPAPAVLLVCGPP